VFTCVGWKVTLCDPMCNVFHDQARRHMSELSVKLDIMEVPSWHTLRSVILTSFFDVNS